MKKSGGSCQVKAHTRNGKAVKAHTRDGGYGGGSGKKLSQGMGSSSERRHSSGLRGATGGASTGAASKKQTAEEKYAAKFRAESSRSRGGQASGYVFGKSGKK